MLTKKWQHLRNIYMYFWTMNHNNTLYLKHAMVLALSNFIIYHLIIINLKRIMSSLYWIPYNCDHHTLISSCFFLAYPLNNQKIYRHTEPYYSFMGRDELYHFNNMNQGLVELYCPEEALNDNSKVLLLALSLLKIYFLHYKHKKKSYSDTNLNHYQIRQDLYPEIFPS